MKTSLNYEVLKGHLLSLDTHRSEWVDEDPQVKKDSLGELMHNRLLFQRASINLLTFTELSMKGQMKPQVNA